MNKKIKKTFRVVSVGFMIAALFLVVGLAVSLAYAQTTDTPAEVSATVDSVDASTASVDVPVSDMTVADTTVTMDSPTQTTDVTVTDTAATADTTATADSSATVSDSSETQPVQSPELSTDKADYHPGETVTIFGKFFQALQDIILKIFGGSSDDGTYIESTQNVTADSVGSFTTAYTLSDIARPLYTIVASALDGTQLATTTFTDPGSPTGSYNLDQSHNGGNSGPNPISPVDWVNGNAGQANSHYTEGQSIPYRVILTGLPTGVSSTVKIEWDIRQSSKNAIDYITGPQRIAEIVDPTIGVAGLSAASYYTIPTPNGNVTASSSFAALPNDNDNKKLWAYNVSALSFEPYVNGSNTTADSSTSITITFTATSSTVVLAWGGHIAAEADWGVGNGATAVSGSPYHTRILELCNGSPLACGGGKQDRSLSANAVTIAPLTGSITLDKVTVPSGDPASFIFSTTGFTATTKVVWKIWTGILDGISVVK